MGTLVEVSMPQNGIYAEGISALSDAFRNNPHLKILNFNDNTVQKEGAEALAKALPGLQSLQTLNLGDCLLKTKGAICIANALASNHLKLEVGICTSNIRLGEIDRANMI
jgi:Ran GTPase-activating protein 1